jgi:hypothetical protein
MAGYSTYIERYHYIELSNWNERQYLLPPLRKAPVRYLKLAMLVRFRG